MKRLEEMTNSMTKQVLTQMKERLRKTKQKSGGKTKDKENDQIRFERGVVASIMWNVNETQSEIAQRQMYHAKE